MLSEILWVVNKMTLVVCLGTPKYWCFIGFLKILKIAFIRSHPHEVYYEKHPPFGWMFFIVYFLQCRRRSHLHWRKCCKIHPPGGCILYYSFRKSTVEPRFSHLQNSQQPRFSQLFGDYHFLLSELPSK